MKFLSDEWFKKVEELRSSAGNLNIPEALAKITINVKMSDTNQELQLKGGEFVKGRAPDAAATITLKSDLAKKIFIENDAQAGMQAFMAGELTVDGDVTKIMEIQTIQPSSEQKALLRKIKEITD
jgi:hypothetical protein